PRGPRRAKRRKELLGQGRARLQTRASDEEGGDGREAETRCRRHARRKVAAAAFPVHPRRGSCRRLLDQARSDQTASSLPAGSRKWKRRPPGKGKMGTVISPPAASTRASVASRSSE